MSFSEDKTQILSKKPSMAGKRSSQLDPILEDGAHRATVDENDNRPQQKMMNFFNTGTSMKGLDVSQSDSPQHKGQTTGGDNAKKGGTAGGKKQKPPPGKPYNWNKLGEKDREELFLRTYDENMQLKQRQTDLEKSMRQLKTQLQVIDTEYQMTVKATSGGGGGGGERINRENLIQVEELRRENAKLREKVTTMTQAHAVLSQAAQKKQQSSIRSGGMASAHAAEDHDELLKTRGTLTDMVTLIDRLKAQLKETQEANRRLQGMVSDKVTIETKDSAGKNVQLQQLKSRYDEIYQHFQHQSKKLEQTSAKLVELQMQLNEERETNFRLNTSVRQLEIRLKSTEADEEEVHSLKREKAKLEERLRELSQSPFFEKFKEEATSKATARQLEQELAQMRANNESLKERCKKLEVELEEKKKDIAEKDKDLEEKRQTLAELKKAMTDKDSQIEPFKNIGDLDHDSYMRALGVVKWKGETPIWQNLQVIDRKHRDLKDSTDSHQLKKEISNLILEKGELASHLQRTQQLLQQKTTYEAEQSRLHRAELEKLRLQLKQAQQRAEELIKIQELKGHYNAGATSTGMGLAQTRFEYAKDGVKYSDSVSIFSTDDSDAAQALQLSVDATANALDIFIGNVDFDEPSLKLIIGGDTLNDPASMLSFCTVDFYDHETQHSSIAQGLKSKYLFQLTFKVNLDEFFLQYMQSNSIRIDVYIAIKAEAKKIGTAVIPLLKLIEQNKSADVSAVVKGDAVIQGRSDPSSRQEYHIGTIDYIMRMRYPIAAKVKQLSTLLGRNELSKFDDD